MLEPGFMQRPLAQQIIRALDALEGSQMFCKSHRPEEQHKQAQARATLQQLQQLAPVTYAGVMRRLGRR